MRPFVRTIVVGAIIVGGFVSFVMRRAEYEGPGGASPGRRGGGASAQVPCGREEGGVGVDLDGRRAGTGGSPAPATSAGDLVAHGPDGLAVIDADARFVDANPAAVLLCGLLWVVYRRGAAGERPPAPPGVTYGGAEPAAAHPRG